MIEKATISAEKYKLGPFRLDVQRYQLLRDEVPVRFSKLKFIILRLLLESRNAVVTYDTLWEAGWPGETDPPPGYDRQHKISVHIDRIRGVLEEFGPCIDRAPKVGYWFSDKILEKTVKTLGEKTAPWPEPPHVAFLSVECPKFKGRKAEIEMIRQRAELPGGRVQVLRGLPGMGKTQLALKYANEARHFGFQSIGWVPSEDPSLIHQNLISIATEWGLWNRISEEELKREDVDQVQLFKEWLIRNSGWLLVYDNVESLDHIRDVIIRRQESQILVTTRANGEDWDGIGDVFDCPPLAPEEAVAFLKERTGNGDLQGASDLAEELKCVPLALEQAASYMVTRPATYQEFLNLLQNDFRAAMSKSKPGEYPETVWQTFQICFSGVRKIECAETLLKLCAFWASENMPLSVLLDHASTVMPMRDAALLGDSESRHEIMNALRRFSLLSTDTLGGGTSLSMHRLVQRLALESIPAEERVRFAEYAFDFVDLAFPDPLIWNAYQYRQFDFLYPHCLAVLSHADYLPHRQKDIIRLKYKMSRYLLATGNLKDAEKLAQPLIRESRHSYALTDPLRRRIYDVCSVIRRERSISDPRPRRYALYALVIALRNNQDTADDRLRIAFQWHHLGRALGNFGPYRAEIRRNDPMLRKALQCCQGRWKIRP